MDCVRNEKETWKVTRHWLYALAGGEPELCQQIRRVGFISGNFHFLSIICSFTGISTRHQNLTISSSHEPHATGAVAQAWKNKKEEKTALYSVQQNSSTTAVKYSVRGVLYSTGKGSF